MLVDPEIKRKFFNKFIPQSLTEELYYYSEYMLRTAFERDALNMIKLTFNLGSARACRSASALAAVVSTCPRGGGRGGRHVRGWSGASPAGLLPPVDEPLRASAFSSSKGFDR